MLETLSNRRNRTYTQYPGEDIYPHYLDSMTISLNFFFHGELLMVVASRRGRKVLPLDIGLYIYLPGRFDFEERK